MLCAAWNVAQELKILPLSFPGTPTLFLVGSGLWQAFSADSNISVNDLSIEAYLWQVNRRYMRRRLLADVSWRCGEYAKRHTAHGGGCC